MSDQASDDRFATDINHLGLRVFGSVADTAIESVSVAVNDRIVKQVDIDRSQTVGGFTFTIRHASLESFPERAQVSVLAGERPLSDEYGGTTSEIHCPFGDASLFERLDRGEVFTKKGALVPVELTEISPQRLLHAYSQVRTFFAERLALDLFLMYGTLLGCHRDGRFIPGDDDLDVGFVTACTDPDSLKHEAVRIANEALAAGFDVTTRHGGALLKIWIDEIDIDIYPIWFHLGRAWGYDAMVADRDDFVPTSRRNLLGTEVLIPRHPDTLLESTYGSKWRIPQPGFRHYRSRSVMNIVNRTALTPREAKELLEANAEARRHDHALGSFEMHNGGPG